MAKVVGGRRTKKKETEVERLLRLYRETGIAPGVTQLPDDLPEYEIYRPGEGGMEYGAYPRGQADYVSPAEPQVVDGPSQGPGGRGAAAAAAAAEAAAAEGLLPGTDYRELGTGISPDFIPGQYGTGMDEAWAGAAEEEAAQKESARIAAEEKAYTEGRVYGDYSEDIGAKRQRYMDALEEIQTKARRLNMIAGLTGGTSQADSFTQAALARLDKMEEFNDDERLHQIRTGVYYDQEGNWNAPKSKKEAYNRAIKFGASAAEAAHISGGEPEPVGMVNWRYTGDDPNIQRIISRPRGDPPDDPEYVRYGGTGEDAATSKDERHLLARSTLLQNGDIMGAIQKEVDFIGASRPTGDPEQHRAIATQRIWPLIPEGLKVEKMFNSQEEIDAAEAELYAAGVRWVLLGPSISPKLVALEPPVEVPEDELEVEPYTGMRSFIPRFARETRN